MFTIEKHHTSHVNYLTLFIKTTNGENTWVSQKILIDSEFGSTEVIDDANFLNNNTDWVSFRVERVIENNTRLNCDYYSLKHISKSEVEPSPRFAGPPVQLKTIIQSYRANRRDIADSQSSRSAYGCIPADC